MAAAMTDMDFSRRLDALAEATQETRERVVRIEIGAEHRDEKLDGLAARLEKIDTSLAAMSATLADARLTGRIAVMIGRNGWGLTAALAAFVVANWQSIKRWLP